MCVCVYIWRSRLAVDAWLFILLLDIFYNYIAYYAIINLGQTAYSLTSQRTSIEYSVSAWYQLSIIMYR